MKGNQICLGVQYQHFEETHIWQLASWWKIGLMLGAFAPRQAGYSLDASNRSAMLPKVVCNDMNKCISNCLRSSYCENLTETHSSSGNHHNMVRGHDAFNSHNLLVWQPNFPMVVVWRHPDHEYVLYDIYFVYIYNYTNVIELFYDILSIFVVLANGTEWLYYLIYRKSTTYTYYDLCKYTIYIIYHHIMFVTYWM